MESLHKEILTRLRNNIILDVDVYNGVMQPLKSEYILLDQDVFHIQNGSSKQDKAEILLDILPSRGPYAFDAFREALRRHYEWISMDMDKLEEQGTTVSNVKFPVAPILPPISPLTVNREQKMTQLKNSLEKLQPNGYVVLHGMKGFGKSCLTASTLKDKKFVRNLFYNKVYWIKFGNKRPIDEEILVQLNRLYHLVKNLELLPEALKSESLTDSLVDFVKHHFSREDHCQALLILDDVSHSKIIEAFDFECKTLVITANLDVVWEKRPCVIKMNDGFTEAESLGLFAKVLETDVDKLPSEAKKIHDECKGMPLLIAMFSAQFEEFKDDMKLYPERWRFYLDSLRNKDEKNRVMKKFFEKQEAIFNMYIEQLPNEIRKRYEELVIFREDVNITRQTLQILWGEGQFQVEEMMLDLCHKSLAAKQWNDELHSYIYGVHDLLLCHLRKKMSQSELVKMHKLLIEKYRNYCNGDFSKLPADNYSYSYIGYHLEQAQLFDDFPNIYLNFDFIQAAIIHSGLTNLLIDLKNYRQYITKNCDPIYEARFIDVRRFLEEQASIIAEHRRKKCLDIVQIAMNHHYEGYIKDTAIKLASERCKKLYVFHDRKSGQMTRPSSEEMSTDIHTSSFANDPDLILVGGKSGKIILWDSVKKTQKVFNGHEKTCSIKKLAISTEGDCFLSLDDNGTVKLFRLLEDENCDQNSCLLSPKQKQPSWSGIFDSKFPHDDSSIVFSVPGEIILDVTFGLNNTCIAACTNRGTIRIWDRCGRVLFAHSHNPQSDCHLKNIAFSMESNLLHTIDEVHGVLTTYSKNDAGYNYLSQYNPDLARKKIIFFHNVPKQNNSLFIVTEEKAVYIKWFRSNNDYVPHSYIKQTRANVESKNIVYVCAAITNDGQYLILADSAGFINTWKTDVGDHPIATYKSRVSSLDTYWLKDDGYHIICGSENRLLNKWKLPVEGICKSSRKRLFDAAVQQYGKDDIVVTETVSNTIVTLVGGEVVAESEPIDGEITNLILSSDRKKIVYVTDKGRVILFNIDSKEAITIFNVKNIELLKILNVQSGSIIVCRETDHNLSVWQSKELSYLIDNVGYVIFIHEVNDMCVLTITRNGVITLWSINGTNWFRRDSVTIDGAGLNIVTIFSCLSYYKTILTVLTENKDIVLFKLEEDTITQPICIRIIEHGRLNCTEKLTCCEITQDEMYLAVGFENGDISVINIARLEEMHKLRFHANSVTQLFWAPSLINVPILLSVNADELVWWNIDLATQMKKQQGKSRSRLDRCTSFPFINNGLKINTHMSTSQSADSNMYSAQRKLGDNVITDGVNNQRSYWLSKEGKDPNQPALLAVVELSSNFLAKVCISNDFSKLITVDIYGSISTFAIRGCN